MNPDFMREAIRLSLEKMEAGEDGPFGAVIVQNGRIVGRGWNRVTSTNDPTAHAEIVAIRDACAYLKTFSLVGCEIYTSCEPCPMCFAAIYWARLERIYYAATCQDAAAAGFDDCQFYREVALPPSSRSIPMIQDRPSACKSDDVQRYFLALYSKVKTPNRRSICSMWSWSSGENSRWRLIPRFFSVSSLRRSSTFGNNSLTFASRPA
jgi:guanine deaminase